jgi:hypothetical protein
VIGWLCVVAGMQNAAFALVTAFATARLAVDPASAVGVGSAWVSHSLVSTLMAFPIVIMLRFPTGRLLGPGWRRWERACLAAIGVLVLMAAVEPMPLVGFPTTPNPAAIGSPRLTAFGASLFAVMFAVPIGVSVTALVVRYRRGSVTERLQLRWLAAASVVLGTVALSTPLTAPEVGQGRLSTASSIGYAIGFSAIPIAIGIAIVRYRLYDIDRLVKRTLVYALVSGVLGIVYATAVLGLSAPLTAILPAAGGTLTTAASTLLVAALFRPVRRRAQVAVDRRFDRERHEATTTVEAFGGRIRGEVELDAIVGDLLAGAGRVVHPTSSSCWLRPRGSAGRALVASAGGP